MRDLIHRGVARTRALFGPYGPSPAPRVAVPAHPARPYGQWVVSAHGINFVSRPLQRTVAGR